MTTQLFTLYDRIAMQTEGIFHARNEADAMRAFSKRFSTRDDSDDFNLLHLGSMNHDTGAIQLFDVPQQIPISLKPPKKDTNE